MPRLSTGFQSVIIIELIAVETRGDRAEANFSSRLRIPAACDGEVGSWVQSHCTGGAEESGALSRTSSIASKAARSGPKGRVFRNTSTGDIVS